MKKLLFLLLPFTVLLLVVAFGSYVAWPEIAETATGSASISVPTSSDVSESMLTPHPENTPQALSADDYPIVVEIQIVDDVTGELIKGSRASVQLVIDDEITPVMIMQGPVFQMPVTLSTVFRWEPSAEGYEPSPGVYEYRPDADTVPASEISELDIVESRMIPKKGGG